nr:MAG TPA: hypothetical protein [Caudoviricetes sp.]
MWFSCHDTTKLRQENEDALNKPRHSVKRRMNMLICVRFFVILRKVSRVIWSGKVVRK